MKKYYICFVMIFASLTLLKAQSSDVENSGYEISAEGAWCWFADPRAVHHANPTRKIDKTYVGYIDVHGNIKAMQYDYVSKKQVEVLVRSWFQPDDHNNPTFLILPDDRVMVFYARHTDENCFYYRISQEPGDITTLGEEKRLVTDHNTTYPSAFFLTDDPNHIYLCWRGLNWHPTVAKLSLPNAQDEVAFTSGPYQIVQSTGARPYAKYMSNGKDKIYLTYTTGHPDNEFPNFLYFNVLHIKELQLKDVEGNVLANIENGPFHITKQDSYVQRFSRTVVDRPQARDWVWQVASDKAGRPVIAMVRISEDKKTHDYYYAKWTGTDWKKTFLANGGGHFHQTPDLELCYSGGMAIDPDDTRIVYCAVPIAGHNGTIYELVKYRLDDEGNVIDTLQITHNSMHNNIRPYVIPGSKKKGLRLTWMHGNYYDWIVSKSRPGYPTAIHGDFKGFESRIHLHKGHIPQDRAFAGKLGKEFSIVARIDRDNLATHMLRIGPLSYQIDAQTGRPQVVYNGKVYKSTNVLGTADSWKQIPRGTNGKWHDPQPLNRFHLTMTYSKGILQTYINGLLDQHISLEKGEGTFLQADTLSTLPDIRFYKRLLHQQEIKQLSESDKGF